jgi:hypothetical protein
VRELGDFVAHVDKRTKGITTKVLRDYFTFMRFSGPHIQRGTNASNLPAIFPKALKANFKQFKDSDMKTATGLNRRDAEKMLHEIINRLVPNSVGGWTLKSANEIERKLINTIVSVMFVQPAFTEDSLYNEFSEVLAKNHIVTAAETGKLSRLKAPLSLFAISVMHRCRIDLGDGTEALLRAFVPETGLLRVLAMAEIQLKNKQDDDVPVPIMRDLMTTSLKGEDYCSAELLEFLKVVPNNWDFSIEMDNNKRLILLK